MREKRPNDSAELAAAASSLVSRISRWRARWYLQLQLVMHSYIRTALQIVSFDCVYLAEHCRKIYVNRILF